MIERHGDLTLIVNKGAAVVMDITGPSKDTLGKPTPNIVKVRGYTALDQVQFANWGSNNRRPQDIITEMDKSGIAKAGLRVRMNAHYGDGPEYYRMGDEGHPEPVKLSATELKPCLDFARANRLPALLKEAVMNFEWWGMVHAECVVDNACRTITSVQIKKAAWIRHSLGHEETGHSEWAVLNPNWGIGDDSTARLIPMAHPWWSAEQVREWLKDTGYRKFIWPVMIPDPDAGYYPDLEWHALYDNGWLHSTNRIPKYKDKMFTRQLGVRWFIKIPKNYWPAKFGEDNWAALSPALKEAKKQEVYALIESRLTGEDNAGKVLVAEMQVDDMGQPLPGWEIVPLDDKLKEGMFLPDANKGNSEILASMLVDPTLLGQGASGTLGAGSGSDKREAYNILTALLYTSEEQTTEWWNLVRDFNGWDPTLCLGYATREFVTTDVAKSGVLEDKPKPPAPLP